MARNAHRNPRTAGSWDRVVERVYKYGRFLRMDRFMVRVGGRTTTDGTVIVMSSYDGQVAQVTRTSFLEDGTIVSQSDRPFQIAFDPDDGGVDVLNGRGPMVSQQALARLADTITRRPDVEALAVSVLSRQLADDLIDWYSAWRTRYNDVGRLR